MAVVDEPILTDTFAMADAFRPTKGSAFINGRSVEERSAHASAWANDGSVELIEIVEENDAWAIARRNGEDSRIMLRSERQLDQLATDISAKTVYLDVTGLSHHVWAPLLRGILRNKSDVKVIYVEPADYKFAPAPTEGQIFDLSERIKGPAPLPGFAWLTGTGDNSLFVPLLGFEGLRLALLLEQAQPGNDKIVPIVGVPGFQPEFPFYTYLGNQRTLVETGAWQRIQFVPANCPFAIFYLLERIGLENPSAVLRVALIGTKPHAIGAVLFKLVSAQAVELLYDHPIRKPGRTRGTDRLHVYHVSSMYRGRR